MCNPFLKKRYRISMSNFFICMFPIILQNLERKERNQTIYIEQLSKKQRFLKWRVEQLVTYNEAMCKRRSVSECSSSSSTISSINSLECMRSFTSISCEPGKLFLFLINFRLFFSHVRCLTLRKLPLHLILTRFSQGL